MSALEELQQLVERDKEHDCEGLGPDHVCVKVIAAADLPTRFGRFAVAAFWNNRDAKEHIAIIKGDVLGASRVLTRMHSECLTGDSLGSLRCDCRDQLEQAMRHIAQVECGLLLYLRQEGRGIGLLNKIRAYALQDAGMDTVEANEALGFRADERDYAVAAHMLRSLRVQSVRLLTNNPEKVAQLEHYGVSIVERVPHVMKANAHNQFYLQTKADKSGHFIKLEDKRELAEQNERVVVEGVNLNDI